MKISQQQLVDLIKEEFAASELNEFGRWRGAIERLLDRDPKTGKRVYAGSTEELKEGDDPGVNVPLGLQLVAQRYDDERALAIDLASMLGLPKPLARPRPASTRDERAEAEKALNKRLSSLREEDELVALQETLIHWQKIIKS
jgi:hypothetical protein